MGIIKLLVINLIKSNIFQISLCVAFLIKICWREEERKRKRETASFWKLIKTIVKICRIEIISCSGVNLGSFRRRIPPLLWRGCKGVYDNYDKMDVKLNRKQKTQRERDAMMENENHMPMKILQQK